LLVSSSFSERIGESTLIVVDYPHEAFLKIIPLFRQTGPMVEPGVSDRAQVDPTATIADSARIGPFVTIESYVVVGENVQIAAGSFIGSGSTVGDDSSIHPNVTLYRGTVVGRRVVINSGAVIGSDGFGYTPNEEGEWMKIPQTGSVLIEDDVEIGACVTIDRGTIAETRIGRGAKLDNQIHIAHNVQIGENTVIAAQTGVSGSTTIGAGNMIAGQVGIVGHIQTADDVIIEAQSGVSKSIVKAGRYFGHPAKEHSVALRQEGALRQLPDLLREMREMHKSIAELKSQVARFEEEVD
jgi:UDP-3-O-[3-hydroxymyristoyl] glucosamine N-acyltransferase